MEKYMSAGDLIDILEEGGREDKIYIVMGDEEGYLKYGDVYHYRDELVILDIRED